MPTADAQQQPADLVLIGGIVHPLAGPQPDATRPTAVAVTGGTVTAVGSDADIYPLVGPDTTVVSLRGRAVIPGINDGHLHATWLGLMWPHTMLDSMPPAGAFAPAGGAPGAGMTTVGGDPLPPRPPEMLGGKAPQLATAADKRAAILRAGRILAELGITSYTEPGLGPGENAGETGAFDSKVVREYRLLADEGALTARVTVLALYGIVDGPSRLADFRAGLADANWTSRHPKMLHFTGVKIFGDGIPPMHTAYLSSPYPDGGRASLLVAGVTDADRERDFAAMLREAHRAGLQVGVHATGDRTIDLFLDAIAAARAEDDADLRHYVIHGDLVTSAHLKRMTELGVGLATQTGIAVLTHGMVEATLGADRGRAAWPVAAALAAGVPVCLTTDSPVLSPDWRREIAAADTWLGPADDARARMHTLLRCYTAHPARQDMAERWKGTLARGMVADLCVLAADPFALTPAELPDVDVDMTILGGRIVFERAGHGIPTAAPLV